MWKSIGTASAGKYVFAIVPEHPYATKNHYVLEHRIVMENKIGRLLTKEEVVHHINGNTKDNRIENLLLFDSSSSHSRNHMLKIGRAMVELKCPTCGKIFIKERRETHLVNYRNSATFCSRKCSAKGLSMDTTILEKLIDKKEITDKDLEVALFEMLTTSMHATVTFVPW